jgi:hypothetical protein
MRRIPVLEMSRFAAFMSRCKILFCKQVSEDLSQNCYLRDISKGGTYSVHVFRALEKLLHVQFDLTRLKLDAVILEQPSKIVVHVGKDHVH